ncbi:MAG: flagellar biosynthetic protein FliO [Eubacteriales bacterium]
MLEDGLKLLIFLIVLGLTLLAAYYSTRFVGTQWGSATRFMDGKSIQILERLYVGRDQHIMLVKLANRHLLLGCTASQITNLAELTSEEIAELTSANQKEQEGVTFSSWLQKMREQKKD